MKVDAPLIILIVTIVAAIAAYWSNVQSNRQLNRMEKYDSLNLKLGEEIKQLSDLNNTITNRVDKIVAENQSLTHQNIQLTNKANNLIEQVEKLVSSSNELITKVDIRTEKTSAENALTGQIDFQYGNPLKDEEKLIVRAGMIHGVNDVIRYKSSQPPGIIGLGSKDLIPMKIVDGKLKVSVTVYDLSGNLIAEVKDNVWSRSANNISKFNYDSKGFEIIDNHGFTALSINLDSRTEISIEGYFLDRTTEKLYIYGGNSFTSISIKHPQKTIIETIEQANIRRLFEYSGSNWIGKRKVD